MKTATGVVLSAALALTALSWARAQSETTSAATARTQPRTDDRNDLSPQEIVRRFAAKESEFYEAWKQYTYRQTAEVRVLSVNGMPKREAMTTISDIVFKDDGTREVRVLRRASNLRSIVYTMQDEEVIDNLHPFALTEKELPLYDLKYAGKEKVDELSCHVFSVSPKSLKGGKLYFEGKIWVDDQDLQVVRTLGKAVPQKKDNQFPEFETIRQVIDKQYWFPVWTHAESQLRFQRDTIHIEETVTYEGYKRFGSKATIQFEPAKPK